MNMFGQSPSIFGKGNKSGSGQKNAFNFGNFGDENESPSDLFGTPYSAEPNLNDFGNKKDAADSVFKMPEPPGSHPPLQQQRSPAVNAGKQLPKSSPSTCMSPVVSEARTAAAAPVSQSLYFRSSSNISPASTGKKKDDLNKTVTFAPEESILEEEEEEFQEDDQENVKRKQQDESPPQSPSYSVVDTDEEGSVKDVTQSPTKKLKKTVPEASSSNNVGEHRLAGGVVEKIRADFSEIMQQHNKIREEDEKLLQFCSDSLRSKTEELIHQMEEFVRERYDYLTEKIQKAANDFNTIADETQMSESDVNEMKRFMAELIEKHLKFSNDN